MVTFVFPGQGSQKKGMGEGIFDNFTEQLEIADNFLGYSIKDLCIENPDQKLNQTEYTQPALYIINSLMYLENNEESKNKPDFVAGHSLGEYNALFAAGAFDFETGLKMVQKRGELMSQASTGGMAAIINVEEEIIKNIIKNNGLSTITIANYNSPDQIVISGPKIDIEHAKTVFIKEGIKRYMILNVNGAFHSPFMKNTAEEFKNFIKDIKFNKLTLPVISNLTARPYNQEDIKNHLVNQITHPVRWIESIKYLLSRGEMQFEEIGPGMVLSKLIKRITQQISNN